MVGYLVGKILEISCLMQREWVTLKSTLHALDHRQFVCSDCLNQYSGRHDYEKMTEALQRSKGCRPTSIDFLHSIDGKIKFKSCIGNYVSSSAMQWIEAHAHFQRGVLPFPGALSDQPSKIMEVFATIDEHRFEQAKKQAEENRRKARARGGARG